METIEKYEKAMKFNRDRVAIVRDTALLLGCDADLVAVIQEHYNEKDEILNNVREKVA
tara:strand:+ start:389 stop:562 length:174 start_codon:yes stop_codon:yes gene_type:complete